MQVWKKRATHYEEEVVDYEKVILGKCHGVLLTRRGTNDPHVCMQIITEDDENWFVSDSSFSSFWLPNFMTVLREAQDWINQNCDLTDEGWSFKS